MNRRSLLIAGAVVGVVVILLLAARIGAPSTTNTNAGSTVTYTNAITGQSATDLPGEVFDQAPAAIQHTHVIIDGAQSLYGNLTDDQTANAQADINDFLMARSGLENVRAGVKAGSITSSDNQVQFLLVVVRPQATYQVTVKVANQFQTQPDITFKEVD